MRSTNKYKESQDISWHFHPQLPYYAQACTKNEYAQPDDPAPKKPSRHSRTGAEDSLRFDKGAQRAMRQAYNAEWA